MVQYYLLVIVFQLLCWLVAILNGHVTSVTAAALRRIWELFCVLLVDSCALFLCWRR